MSGSQVHLFFPFSSAVGGAENRAYEIARGLREDYEADAQLWSTSSRLHPEMRSRGVKVHMPMHMFLRGSFVFLGVFWKPKGWLRHCRPERLTIIVNAMDLEAFRRNLPIYQAMTPNLRFVYTSKLLRTLFAQPGAIHVSPINLQRFHPAQADVPPRAGTLRVGRHSRDALEKHQLLYDPELYAALAQENVSFDLMGATCLQPLLQENAQIRLRPQLEIEASDYLRGLDCFFYRTGAFLDPAARVVWEAMACGLPVVCHRYGGHADRIVHGENGFLFDDQREAFEILRRLRDDIELRQRVGRNARKSMEQLFAPERLRQMYGSYLSDTAPDIDY